MNTKTMETIDWKKQQEESLARIEELKKAKQAQATQGNSNSPKLSLVHTAADVPPKATSRQREFVTFADKSQPPEPKFLGEE